MRRPELTISVRQRKSPRILALLVPGGWKNLQGRNLQRPFRYDRQVLRSPSATPELDVPLAISGSMGGERTSARTAVRTMVLI
jgi:hypothetical protein